MIIQPIVRPKGTFRSKRTRQFPITFAAHLTTLFSFSLIASLLSGLIILPILPAQAAGSLNIEIIAGYNLPVSAAASASSYDPSTATVGGRFCNTGDLPLTGVQAYIGDFSAGTPGTYPTRDSASFAAEHPLLLNTGAYSFTHLGDLSSASRYLGDLPAGECKTEYWQLTYPRLDQASGTTPVWGNLYSPSDDLWLDFDLWGTSLEGASDDTTRSLYLRAETANPTNQVTGSAGAWETSPSGPILPGQMVTLSRVGFQLGTVSKGFDSDQNFVYDYDASLQPIGDPAFDPGCFRLVATTGVITATRPAGLPSYVLPFTDQLYFPNLPSDNTGVTGEIHYTFAALSAPCSLPLTPYQSAASGTNLQAYNGDYGSSLPTLSSSRSQLSLDKTGPLSTQVGQAVTYQVALQNDSGVELGAPGMGASLAIFDSLPSGLQFISARAPLTTTVLYSTDDGDTWSPNVPAMPGSVTSLQVLIDEPLPPGEGISFSYQASVPGGYPGSFIENTACASVSGGACLGSDSHITLIQGTRSLSGQVWRDEDSDGVFDAGETGLQNISVNLYWDKNANSTLEPTDPWVTTQSSGAAGAYSFDSLPDGSYLAQVDAYDGNVPFGYTPTNSTQAAATLSGSNRSGVNYGFGPALRLAKQLTSANPGYEGEQVTYSIRVQNVLPGSGVINGPCTYYVWSASSALTAEEWSAAPYAFASAGPDDRFAVGDFMNGAGDVIAGDDFSIGSQSGAIVSVEALFRLYLSQPLVDDSLQASFDFAGDGIYEQTNNYNAAVLLAYAGLSNVDLLAWDVTSFRAAQPWSFADFTSTAPRLALTLIKTGSSDSALVALDAIGFRITTNQTCGGGDSTVYPYVLRDDFDASRLQLLSTSPAASITASGAITWTSLGPLYPGGEQVVSLTFLALDTVSTTITNTATLSGARFAGGLPANNPSAYATSSLRPTGSMQGMLWNDNGQGGSGASNGLIDPGELGLAGVSLSVYRKNSNTLVSSTVTGATGSYAFSGLPDNAHNDEYCVIITTSTLPGGNTKPPQTHDPDGKNDDQTCWPINNSDAVITNDSYSALNFGYLVPATVYGTIWEDNSGDGIQQVGENGLPGVTVRLYNASNALVAAQTTLADGTYTFSNLAAGWYYVSVYALPAGPTWTQTADPEGDLNGRSNARQMQQGYILDPVNFGYRPSGQRSISGAIYRDWNGSASRQIPEEGLRGVMVSLYEDASANGIIDPAADALITSIETTAGSYTFPGLAGGGRAYIIFLSSTDPDLPSAYQQTQDPDESGPCTTCDGRAARTLTTTDAANVNFGYQPAGYGSIGNLVWSDTDRDAIPDLSESGIANVTIRLYEDSDGDGLRDGEDAPVITATSSLGGEYAFTGLPAWDFLVEIDETDLALPLDPFGEPYVLSTGTSRYVIDLSEAENDLSADFGFTPGGQISGLVWQDNNRDGLSTGEPGLPGITLSIYQDIDADSQYDSGSDPLWSTQSTSAAGAYTFTSLPAGSYIVIVDTADPDLPTAVITGDPDALPPCAPGLCDAQTAVHLAAGQSEPERSFGFAANGVLAGRLWIDASGDGLPGADESGLGGVSIELYQGAALIHTILTSAEGSYSFGDLPDDAYTIRVNTASLPVGLAASTDPDGVLDQQTTVSVSGGTNFGLIFGYRYSGSYSIRGSVFFDSANNGGLYSPPADLPYAGIPVYLWKDGALVATLNSSASGAFIFSSLAPGSYRVAVNTAAPRLAGMSLNTLGSASYYNITISNANAEYQDFGFYGQLDFGDLPASYNLSKLEREGARHTLGSLYLGAHVDLEGDGQESLDATGDDLDGTNDDDGVVRTPSVNWMNGAGGGSIDVTVTGGNGFLAGWVDWNKNGTFNDAGEKVLAAQSVAAGFQTVPLDIPEGVSLTGQFNTRFRLYAANPGGSAQPVGLSTSGEVEDYQWDLTPTAVIVAAFTGEGSPAGAHLEWITALETGNLGFNLYRSESFEGPRILLNGSPIPSQEPGSMSGASYAWNDETVSTGQSYWYWLELVSVWGDWTISAPVQVWIPPVESGTFRIYLPILERDRP